MNKTLKLSLVRETLRKLESGEALRVLGAVGEESLDVCATERTGTDLTSVGIGPTGATYTCPTYTCPPPPSNNCARVTHQGRGV